MRVLLAVITNGQCSLGNAFSMLQLQTALNSAPNVQVTIHVAASLKEAVDLAVGGEEPFDALVGIGGHVTFPPTFVLRGLVEPSPFVTGIYPLPTVDWKRVVDKGAGSREELRFAGNTYNVDASKGECRGGYLIVKAAEELGAVVLKKAALDVLAKSADTSDRGMCEAWGKDIHADLESPCSSTGTMEFMGCVGARAVLR